MKFEKLLLLMFMLIIVNIGYALFYSDEIILKIVGIVLGPIVFGWILAGHKYFT